MYPKFVKKELTTNVHGKIKAMKQEISKLNHAFCIADLTLPGVPLTMISESYAEVTMYTPRSIDEECKVHAG
jgi:hypothetical protein